MELPVAAVEHRLKPSFPHSDPPVMGPSDRCVDSGGIVLGWLLKIVAILLILGLAAYDLVVIAVAKVTTTDDTSFIARGASEAIVLRNATAEEAVLVAKERAKSRGVKLGGDDITIDSEGSVTVSVHRTADTLFVSRIGPLQQFGEVDETYTTRATE
ncbi:MAG: hypothetical protein V9E98_06065 [Candidatus Nanopelagicales bacterium]